MNIAVVGMGLIGGSIAKALSYSGEHRIVGFDISEEVLLDAISAGAIVKKGSEKDLGESDVIFLCLYPKDVVKFTEENAMHFGKNTILTDVCGIKNGVFEELKSLSKKWGFTYVGGHPMAGKEIGGFGASDGGLFRGASYIITQEEIFGTDTIRILANEMGFAKIIAVSHEEHDRMIAFTSQLPHVLACAYVMSPQCLKHEGFSAGSYRDVSRVAKINEELWTSLFLSNRDKLSEEINILSENIRNIQDAINNNDEACLKALLKKAREIKETV